MPESCPRVVSIFSPGTPLPMRLGKATGGILHDSQEQEDKGYFKEEIKSNNFKSKSVAFTRRVLAGCQWASFLILIIYTPIFAVLKLLGTLHGSAFLASIF